MSYPSPQFSKEALQNCEALKSIIRETIKKQGPISFAKYMEMALLTPELGYYSGQQEKIGIKGDFVTAPELGGLFAQCLAEQFSEILKQIDEPTILEIGAGTGQLAYDCLTALASLNALPKKYIIVEPSKNLKKRQQQKLAELQQDFACDIQWCDDFPTEALKGVIIANEVLDVLPFYRFEWHPEQSFELQVHLDKSDNFVWHKAPTFPALAKAISKLELSPKEITPGYQSEICLENESFIAKLAHVLHSGVIFLIDYGFPQFTYYHPERSEGTLMCHLKHVAHDDPFLYPGLQDITASVDFSVIAELAEKNHCDIYGFCHLAGFLMNCGILDLMQAMPEIDAELNIRQVMDMLLSPTEMGEMFKVLAVGKNFHQPLRGFQEFDRQVSLWMSAKVFAEEDTLLSATY